MMNGAGARCRQRTLEETLADGKRRRAARARADAVTGVFPTVVVDLTRETYDTDQTTTAGGDERSQSPVAMETPVFFPNRASHPAVVNGEGMSDGKGTPPSLAPQCPAVDGELPLELSEKICSGLSRSSLIALIKQLRFTKHHATLKMAALASLGDKLGFRFKNRKRAYHHTLTRLRRRKHCFRCGSRAKTCPPGWSLVPKCLACMQDAPRHEGRMFNASQLRRSFRCFRKLRVPELEARLGGVMMNANRGCHFFMPASLLSKLYDLPRPTAVSRPRARREDA